MNNIKMPPTNPLIGTAHIRLCYVPLTPIVIIIMLVVVLSNILALKGVKYWIIVCMKTSWYYKWIMIYQVTQRWQVLSVMEELKYGESSNADRWWSLHLWVDVGRNWWISSVMDTRYNQTDRQTAFQLYISSK